MTLGSRFARTLDKFEGSAVLNCIGVTREVLQPSSEIIPVLL